MKTSMVFGTLAMLLFAACNEFPTGVANDATTPAVPVNGTRSTDRIGPTEPTAPGFSNVKLEAVGLNRIRFSWVWTGEKPQRYVFIEYENGGIEADPAFGTDGNATSYEREWTWYKPSIQYVIFAGVLDSNGVHWKASALTNSLTAP
jgi:hypothetical protein